MTKTELDKKEYQRKYQKEYYRKNSEKKKAYYREYRKEYREKNPEYTREYYLSHREQMQENMKRYAASEKGQRTIRSNHLKAKYGITIEMYDKMRNDQDGKCAICADNHPGYTLMVDHNHTTNAVRGLLCRWCNTALGMLKEKAASMEAAILYIKRHSKTP